jgi:hypothetical protein
VRRGRSEGANRREACTGQSGRTAKPCMPKYIIRGGDIYIYPPTVTDHCPPSLYIYNPCPPRSVYASIPHKSPRPTAATRVDAPPGTPGAPRGAGPAGTWRPAAPPHGKSRDPLLNFTKSARRGPADLKKWPTLYGKVTRARTTSIVNPVPGSIFPAHERLHGVRPPKRGRWVCVKAGESSLASTSSLQD